MGVAQTDTLNACGSKGETDIMWNNLHMTPRDFELHRCLHMVSTCTWIWGVSAFTYGVSWGGKLMLSTRTTTLSTPNWVQSEWQSYVGF